MRHLTLPGEEVAFHQAQLASIAQAANLLVGDRGEDSDGAQPRQQIVAHALRLTPGGLDLLAHRWIGLLPQPKSF